jgi:hypothetical protein
MPEMTAENAVEIVTRKFRAVHKAIETAQDDALDLNRAYLEAARLLGIHPNVSATPGTYIAAAVKELADAQQSAGVAHVMVRDEAERRGLLPAPDVQPLSGGNGKAWP